MRSTVRLAAIAVVVWLCYLPGNMGCGDSMWSIPTAVSLLDHGDADLDEYRDIVASRGGAFTQQVGGHIYTIYPLGTSIVAMPAVAVLRPFAGALARHAPAWWNALGEAAAERGCPPVPGEPVVALHSWTEHVIAAALVAAASAVMFAVATDDVSAAGATLVALVFAFGTPAWSTASRALWQHGPSMLLLALALLLQRRGARMFWIGLLLGFACVVRPTNAIPLVAAAAWVVATRPRALAGFAFGAAISLVPFAVGNLVRYGAWLPPYYTPGFYRRNPFVGEALAGLLVSPSRGLFVFSPIFLLSIAGVGLIALRGRQPARSGGGCRRLTALNLSLAASVAALWLVLAVSNYSWWGGSSYGPRFFADAAPYLTYLLIPSVASIESARCPRRAAATAAVAVLAAVSVGMHARGALSPATMTWNGVPTNIDADPGRVWDWRRPQFLAGLTFMPSASRPVDFDAVQCAAAPGVPGAPVVAANAGGTVTLEWTPATGAVAVYIAEIGGRPGTYDAAPRDARNLLAPSLTVARVPPGTYYVRVFARNRCGDGPPSPETAVVVR
jgi:hypothetical protein